MKTTAAKTGKKRITLATIKSFVNKNRENIFINVEADFDGMIDGLSFRKDGFVKAETDKSGYFDSTLGIKEAWFVGGSRDRFSAYEDNIYIGYGVCNCCGSFKLAIKK